ncbi:MAG: CoA transferase, partial [Burkholderiales bacterium]|nr:CoA transferase [Burkholderiales bacterium]
RPELPADERFANAIARGRHQQALDGIVQDWAGRHTLEEIRRILDAADVPAMGINNVADIFRDPHFRERGMLAEVPDDDLGTVTLTGPVPRLSRTPGRIRRSGGRVGRDTRSVLEQMGWTANEVRDLEKAGVIYSDPQGEVCAELS